MKTAAPHALRLVGPLNDSNDPDVPKNVHVTSCHSEALDGDTRLRIHFIYQNDTAKSEYISPLIIVNGIDSESGGIPIDPSFLERKQSKVFDEIVDSPVAHPRGIDCTLAMGPAELDPHAAQLLKAGSSAGNESSETSDKVSPENPDDDSSPQLITEGTVATITIKGSGQPCYATKDDLDAAIKATINGDKYGFNEIASRAVSLQKNVQIRDIGNTGFLGTTAHLRIEGGLSAGSDCWLPADIKGVFTNIHRDQ